MISPTMQLQAQRVAEDDVIGIWINETLDTLEIYKVDNKFFAKIVELKEPIDLGTGLPKLDISNPDPKLRTRPLKDLTFLKNCVFKENEWTGGEIYDYNNGKTSNCDMKFTDETNLNRLRIRTFGFLFNKTTYWIKKKN
jgi:uncharacterized protein (DUF2147 family)